jgi:hypothetical protein
VGIVARLGFGGRDIADGLEQAPVVKPVDPFQGGKLDRLDAAPGTAGRITSVLNKPMTVSARALMLLCL